MKLRTTSGDVVIIYVEVICFGLAVRIVPELLFPIAFSIGRGKPHAVVVGRTGEPVVRERSAMSGRSLHRNLSEPGIHHAGEGLRACHGFVPNP